MCKKPAWLSAFEFPIPTLSPTQQLPLYVSFPQTMKQVRAPSEGDKEPGPVTQ